MPHKKEPHDGTVVHQKSGSMDQHHEHNKDNYLPADAYAHQGKEYGSGGEHEEFMGEGNCSED